MSTARQERSVGAGDVDGAESLGSLTPLLPGGFPVSSKSPAEAGAGNQSSESNGSSAKSSKRSFWKLGKKTEEDKSKSKEQGVTASKAGPTYTAPATALRPASPLRTELPQRSASPRLGHPYAVPTSPAAGLYSSSPRLHSPASSQIFERNVQEEVLEAQTSPHLPSHIITENHIPPALDASSAAITNQKLDPDDVEIITSSTHQPAAVTITGAGAEQSMSSSFHDDFNHRHALHEDNASNYGTLDSADVRRLSFVSFADVVHAEQAEHADDVRETASHRGSVQLAGLTSHPSLSAPRSPSPMRSPVSSHGLGTSPPTSISASVKGLETSPSRGIRAPGSPPPTTQSPPLGGELNIETMRQALRKTGSGDLSGARSQPMSAVGGDDGTFGDRPFK